MVMSTRETDGIPAPAVTIIAKGKGTKSGWKDDSVSFGFVQKICNNENSTETLYGCIERNTYNLSEIFQHAKIGIGIRAQDIKDVTWKEDFSSAFAGWIEYTSFLCHRQCLISIILNPYLVRMQAAHTPSISLKRLELATR